MDQGDGGTDLKSLEADVVLVARLQAFLRSSQIFSDLLRFKYPNDNIVMVAGQYREAP